MRRLVNMDRLNVRSMPLPLHEHIRINASDNKCSLRLEMIDDAKDKAFWQSVTHYFDPKQIREREIDKQKRFLKLCSEHKEHKEDRQRRVLLVYDLDQTLTK